MGGRVISLIGCGMCDLIGIGVVRHVLGCGYRRSCLFEPYLLAVNRGNTRLPGQAWSMV